MCPGNDNQLDWTAAAIPQGERISSGLARSQAPGPQPKTVQETRRSVMDTLLGKNDLSAMDLSGSDPYNTTGRQFRR